MILNYGTLISLIILIFHILKIEDNNIFIKIRLDDLPVILETFFTSLSMLKKVKFIGVIDENKFSNRIVKVTENLITTTKNYLENKYRKEGF